MAHYTRTDIMMADYYTLESTDEHYADYLDTEIIDDDHDRDICLQLGETCLLSIDWGEWDVNIYSELDHYNFTTHALWQTMNMDPFDPPIHCSTFGGFIRRGGLNALRHVQGEF